MAGLDARDLLRLLEKHARFVLTTHVNPDGDALGSEIALARLIRQVSGPDAQIRIVNRDPVPEILTFLAPREAIEVYDPTRHDAVFARAEIVLGLDNSDPARFGSVIEAIGASSALRVCIDHHPEPDAFWDMLLVDETACSTAEIVHGLFRVAGVEPGPDVATALYTALVTDTGRFRFTNADDAAFTMAAELVRSGASPAHAYSRLEERLDANYLRLLGHVLAEAEFLADGRVVILRARPEDMGRFEGHHADLGEIINLALRVETTRVAALFREVEPGTTKVSLRSKGRLDVNRLARRHGGGGHRNASGIVLEAALDGAVDKVSVDLVALVADEP